MLQHLIAIKLAAMAAALGLNTKDWTKPSKEMEAQVQKLEDAIKLVGQQDKAEQMQNMLNAASQEIKSLADKGDKDAQFAMGLLLQQSNQQGALQQVVDYYTKAANQGQLQAMNNLGFIIAASSRDPEQQKKGVEWIKKASDAGLNPARRNMAQILMNGMAGVTRDPAAAEKLLTTAANDNDADATYLLSQFYLGAGGADKQDEKKGFSLLDKAANMGNANALDLLGTLYLQGGHVGKEEIKPDPKKAVEKFKKLAEEKNPVGLRKMGGVYEQGIPGVVEKDFKKALESYVAAAQGNDALAQFRLGSMNDTGVVNDPKSNVIDVPQNHAAALSYYKLAAQNGMALASYNVGVFYEQGRSVDRDLQKAFASYMQAAQSGVNVAMQKVGDYYLNGVAPMRDPVAAAGWYARSAASGLPEGWLSYGVVTESGLVDKESPFYAAADCYKNAYRGAAVLTAAADEAKRDHSASDNIALAAYLRLGSLYARGVFVPKNDPPKPDFERAYVFFKQALDISNGKNQVAKDALSQVEAKLSAAEKKKGDEDIATMKKELEKYVEDVKKQAANAQAGAAAPAASPVAEPVSPPPATPVKPKKGKP